MKQRFKILLIIFLFGMQWCIAQQSLLWANGFHGPGGGSGHYTISDASGNIYHTGHFAGTVDFDPGPGVTNLTAGNTGDTYISKSDPNGNLLWIKQMGGNGYVYFNMLERDAAGNIYACGNFTGTIDFDPGAGVFNFSCPGSSDIVIAKYDPNGNFVWAKQVGSSATTEFVTMMRLDASNNFYLTGGFYGTVDFDPSAATFAMTSYSVATRDAYILKLNSLGNFVWAKQIGGQFDDGGYSVFIDGTGNVFTSGYFADYVDFAPTPTATAIFHSGTIYGAYISKLDAGGNYLAAWTFSAVGSVIGQNMALDASGNMYLTGYTSGTIDFDPSGFTNTLTTAGSNDAYIVKLNSTGTYQWARLIGGTSLENGWSLTLDANNNVYILGNFQGIGDFDPGPGTFSLTSQGANDIFIEKLDPSGNFMCASSIGGTADEYPANVHIDINGDVHATGWYSNGADFDPSPGTYTLPTTGTSEDFMVKFAKLVTGTPLNYTICAGAPLQLVGNSANTYSWSPATGLSSTTGTSVTATPTSNITYTVLGIGNCYNTTTVITVAVKTKPTFVAPTSPQTVICIPDSILLQSSSSNTNTIFKWRNSLSTTYTNQPYYVKNPGFYYGVTTDTNVGCSDSALIQIKDGKIAPNAKITSHTYINALTPLDTVTCYQPSVTIVGASDTANVVITWKAIANNSVYANPVTLTSGNNLKLFVKRNNNGCSDSSIVALVNQDNALPNAIITSTTNTQLNCSVYSTSVSALFSPSTCTSLWNTPSSSTITNPSTVSIGGKYKLAVTNPDNGCVKLDSINITQTNNILMNTSSDFTVCKNSATTLSAQAIGTLTSVSYSWTGGQTGSSVSVSTSLTTNFIVTATSGSCIGTGTVKVNIPPDIQDSIIAYRSCNDNTTGTILIFAKGGIAPYKYSINNGTTYFTSNSFTSIPFGVYNVAIKDSIGCVRQTTASVSPGSSLPEPKFLASTKNQMGDTIVLVDISIPKPDSVQWVFPSNITKIGGSMFNPIVVSNDTGNFTITMKGFYGNCIINTTKLVRFAPYDSLKANYNNANGVKTFSLYPNPNTGQFTVYIEFYRTQNASIQVWDLSPTKHFQQNFYDVISITLPVDVSSLQNGGYLLRVIAEFDAKNKPFIISK